MPIPRPSAGSMESGIEMTRIRTKIAASDAERQHDAGSPARRRKLEPRLAQRDEREHGERR